MLQLNKDTVSEDNYSRADNTVASCEHQASSNRVTYLPTLQSRSIDKL